MASDTARVNPGGKPLETLFERAGLSAYELPPALTAIYGGSIGFSAPCVLANFVASVDGVVALAEGGESGHIISRGSDADRFVMGLLRACADTVLVGAGTFRRTHGDLWRAEAIYPEAAEAFADARKRLGLAPHPRFVVVTGSGDIDPAQPALDGALVVTSRAGYAALAPRVSSTTRVVAAGEHTVRLSDVVALLQSEGTRVLLTEGGPSVVAELVAAKLLDELFLTSSPALFGRFPNDRRKSLTDGVDLGGAALELLSVKRHGSYVFLRYSTRRGQSP